LGVSGLLTWTPTVLDSLLLVVEMLAANVEVEPEVVLPVVELEPAAKVLWVFFVEELGSWVVVLRFFSPELDEDDSWRPFFEVVSWVVPALADDPVVVVLDREDVLPPLAVVVVFLADFSVVVVDVDLSTRLEPMGWGLSVLTGLGLVVR
jgi:hypothetical protein